MRIGQFWRLYAIFNYTILLPERFSLYDTESMKGARRRKNAACVLPAAYSGTRTAHYRSRHKFVDSTIYDALLNAFFCLDYSFLSLTQRAAALCVRLRGMNIV